VAANLDAHEAKVVEAIAGDWSRQVVRFRRALLALWSASDGRITAADVRALATRLDTRPAVVDAAILLTPAARIGDARVSAKTNVDLDLSTPAIIARAQGKPADAVAEMQRRAGALDLSSMSGLLGVLGPLGRSVNELGGAAQYATHKAANEATAAAARQVDASVVFVPERDACLECNGYAGLTGEEALAVMPPVHPWCRCELQEFSDPDVPKALQREALRSVLRGFSLPSESTAERLRATSRALASLPRAPQSVIDYARNAVKRGGYGSGRSVPTNRKR
jgi:hypothetical protein